MKNNSVFKRVLVTGVTAMAACATLAARDITTIDPPNSVSTVTRAVNSNEQVVGHFINKTNRQNEAFIFSNGAYTIYSIIEAIHVFAADIDDKGRTSGTWVDSKQVPHGYLRGENGTIEKFDPKNSIWTIVTAMNLDAWVVGHFKDGNQKVHGFIRKPGGTIITVDCPNSLLTRAIHINNNGDVTGSCTDQNKVVHGYIRHSDGTFLIFDPPNTKFTRGLRTDDLGNVMGICKTVAGEIRGFVRHADGTFELIRPPRSAASVVLAFVHDLGLLGKVVKYEEGGETSKTAEYVFFRDALGEYASILIKDALRTDVTNAHRSGYVVGRYWKEGLWHGFMTNLKANETACGADPSLTDTACQ